MRASGSPSSGPSFFPAVPGASWRCPSGWPGLGAGTVVRTRCNPACLGTVSAFRFACWAPLRARFHSWAPLLAVRRDPEALRLTVITWRCGVTSLPASLRSESEAHLASRASSVCFTCLCIPAARVWFRVCSLGTGELFRERARCTSNYSGNTPGRLMFARADWINLLGKLT